MPARESHGRSNLGAPAPMTTREPLPDVPTESRGDEGPEAGLIVVHAIDDGTRAKLSFSRTLATIWFCYLALFGVEADSDQWIMVLMGLGGFLVAGTLLVVLVILIRPLMPRAATRTYTLALDEGGLRCSVNGLHRYYPRQRGLDATFDEEGALLAIFAFDGRFSTPVTHPGDVAAAKELCARIATWKTVRVSDVDPALAGLLERRARSVVDWSAQIGEWIGKQSPPASPREAKKLRTKLLRIFSERSQPIEARAAAGYALLVLDPSAKLTPSSSAPPLVVAMVTAAAPRGKARKKRFSDIAPFLDSDDRVAVQNLLTSPAPPR